MPKVKELRWGSRQCSHRLECGEWVVTGQPIAQEAGRLEGAALGQGRESGAWVGAETVGMEGNGWTWDVFLEAKLIGLPDRLDVGSKGQRKSKGDCGIFCMSSSLNDHLFH